MFNAALNKPIIVTLFALMTNSIHADIIICNTSIKDSIAADVIFKGRMLKKFDNAIIYGSRARESFIFEVQESYKGMDKRTSHITVIHKDQNYDDFKMIKDQEYLIMANNISQNKSLVNIYTMHNCSYYKLWTNGLRKHFKPSITHDTLGNSYHRKAYYKLENDSLMLIHDELKNKLKEHHKNEKQKWWIVFGVGLVLLLLLLYKRRR